MLQLHFVLACLLMFASSPFRGYDLDMDMDTTLAGLKRIIESMRRCGLHSSVNHIIIGDGKGIVQMPIFRLLIEREKET